MCFIDITRWCDYYNLFYTYGNVAFNCICELPFIFVLIRKKYIKQFQKTTIVSFIQNISEKNPKSFNFFFLFFFTDFVRKQLNLFFPQIISYANCSEVFLYILKLQVVFDGVILDGHIGLCGFLSANCVEQKMKNYTRIIYTYSRFKKKDKFGTLNFALSNLFAKLKI